MKKILVISSQVSALLLLADEPDDDDNCAFKRKKQEAWHGTKCGSTHSFMCYDERLVLVKEKKTWEEALEHCRALEALDPSKPATAYQNHRYDLATLLTEDDHVFAQEKAQEATTQEVGQFSTVWY